MTLLHLIPIGAALVWTSTVVLAYCFSDLSASAGRIPETWVGTGMAFGMLNVALVVAGVWFLPERLPTILRRLIQLVGMAAAFWAAGTLTRALYTLVV